MGLEANYSQANREVCRQDVARRATTGTGEIRNINKVTVTCRGGRAIVQARVHTVTVLPSLRPSSVEARLMGIPAVEVVDQLPRIIQILGRFFSRVIVANPFHHVV